jgi:hypothetical protein
MARFAWQVALASTRSLVSIAHPVHSLDIVRMVVSPRSSHSFGVDVVGYDVVVVGELYMTQWAFPALLHDLAVEQLPHFRVGAKFPVSTRMMGILNPLHTQLPCFADFLDRFPTAAEEGAMNRAVFIAAKFHCISSERVLS